MVIGGEQAGATGIYDLRRKQGVPVPQTMQTKLVKSGAKVVHHARRIIFQMVPTRVGIPKELFSTILYRIASLPDLSRDSGVR